MPRLTARRSLMLVCTATLASCKPAPVSEPLSSFASPTVGEWLFPACKKENDGKRYLVRGFLKPRQTTTLEGDRLSMDLYDSAAGEGRSTELELVEGKHVKLATTDLRNAWKGGAMGKQGTLAGVTLLTTSGDVPLATEVGVVVQLKVLTKFQSDDISACQLMVEELRP